MISQCEDVKERKSPLALSGSIEMPERWIDGHGIGYQWGIEYSGSVEAIARVGTTGSSKSRAA
jgi:hypothetical protein